MDKIEAEFASYVQVRLQYIQNKILAYAKQRMTVGKTVKELKGVLSYADFVIDMAVLNQALQLGIDSEKDTLSSYVGGDITNLSAGIGIKLADNASNPIYQDLIAERQSWLSDTLMDTTLTTANEIVDVGVKANQTFDEISAQLQTSLGLDGERATLIARTEGNYVVNSGQEAFLKSLGIGHFKIVLAEDACDECIDQTDDGQKTFTDNPLPFHPNCRCVIEPAELEDDVNAGTFLGLVGLAAYLQNQKNANQVTQKAIKQDLQVLAKAITFVQKQQGPKGDKGDSIVGPKGEKGNRGEQGEKGDKGDSCIYGRQ